MNQMYYQIEYLINYNNNSSAPRHFDLDKINFDTRTSWERRFDNLNYLYEQMEYYYTNVIH